TPQNGRAAHERGPPGPPATPTDHPSLSHEPCYFTTLTFSFTSWLVGTLPLNSATARTVRLPRTPGLASAGASITSLASLPPAGMVTSGALTPCAPGGRIN